MLHIVGCSYSLGNCWPRYITEPYTNWSVSGAGNEYIYTVVNRLKLSPQDRVIVQFSEFTRIDVILDKDNPFNRMLEELPSVQMRELDDCIAWCTAGPRGAWNNTPAGKKYLTYLMREKYSIKSQYQDSLAYVIACKHLLQDTDHLFLAKDRFHLQLIDRFPDWFPYPPMSEWATENNMLDDDDFHLSQKGNKKYYDNFISKW